MPDILIASYDSGKIAGEIQLTELFSDLWHDAINDPKDLADIAKVLDVPPVSIRKLPTPFRADVPESGFGIVEVAVLFVSAFAVASGKQLGAAAGKALWDDFIYPRLQARRSEALGRRRPAGAKDGTSWEE